LRFDDLLPIVPRFGQAPSHQELTPWAEPPNPPRAELPAVDRAPELELDPELKPVEERVELPE
jgi:hypothetical protein